MSQYKLAERAVLMRLSIGLPGEQRQNPELTGDVKNEHGLGTAAGKWVTNLYPAKALKEIKKLDNEARAYHAAVTLPFDAGIGILPAALIMEYTDKMRQYKGQRDNLIASGFLKDPAQWVNWAIKEHNGTFNPDLYPGVKVLKCPPAMVSLLPGEVLNDGKHWINPDEFRETMAEKFNFRTEPLPVPDAAHFTSTMHSLLGVDAESVNVRVQDAMEEAQKELLRRIIAPVKAMAAKLAESPKQKADGTMAEDIVFRDSLVGNLKEIATLGPKLNISGDPAIDSFCAEITALASHTPKTLRDDKKVRADVAAKAAEVLKRMEGYKL